MTSLRDAVGRVRNSAGKPSAVVPIRPANDGLSFPAPVLSPALQQQIDRLSGNFGLSMPDGPVFDPDAAGFIEAQRLAVRPASEDMIRKWFMVIVGSLAPGSVNPDAVFAALLLVCGDYPAACWCRETAAAIVGKEKFLPLAAVIKEAVQPIADRLTGPLRWLERIAQAKPETAGTVHFGPAREAKGYVLPPPPPEKTPQRRPLRERKVADDIDPDEAAEQDKEARLNAQAQFAALGKTSEEEAAKLRAKNAERGVK